MAMLFERIFVSRSVGYDAIRFDLLGTKRVLNETRVTQKPSDFRVVSTDVAGPT
jgi:hypothetical protein